MSDDPDKSSATSAIVLVIVIVVVAIYSTTFGMQTLQWIAAHNWATDNPWLNDVPQPIAITTAPAAPAPTPVPVTPPGGKKQMVIAQPKTTELSAYNYEFASPWNSKWKEAASAGGAEFRFDSGQVIVFGDPDAQLDTLQIVRTSTSAEYLPFQNLVNETGISSNYALYDAVYSASPSQVSPLTNYAAALRDRTLLLTKLSFGFDLEKKIYSFDFGEKKGFQFGDPAQGLPVALRVFNARDRQFRFLFTEVPNSAGQVTQEDINGIIQSLQPEPFETR
jgi:hypothetical protein